MSTSSAARKRRPAERVVEYDQYIVEKIGTAKAQLKLVELGVGLSTLLIGLIAYLLAIVLIDHWLVDLGFGGRILSLLGLVVLTSWLVVRDVLFPLVKGVNPIFAARVIEDSEPSLKNGLINFLFFRTQKRRLHDLVYQGVQQQAASGLARIKIDSVVDRSHLIRLLLVLATLVVIAAIYGLVTTKSSVQTLARVAAPWRPLTRPARVLIKNVRPGSVDVYVGESVRVLASVQGLRDDESILLIYDSKDQQAVNATVPMLLTSEGDYVGTIPDDEFGLQSDVKYRIKAGDASSVPYRVTVRSDSNLLVKELKYDFADYTGYEERSSGSGDIRALEGTEVTILAEANADIQSAYLEFDPEIGSFSAPPNTTFTSTKQLPASSIEDRIAMFRFTLRMNEERTKGFYSNYQLRMLDQHGQRNREPVFHSIQVIPDLAPEVEVLTPQRREIGVPVNFRQRFEVRAVDPDFAVRRLRVHVALRGQELVATDMISDPQIGQIVEDFQFIPAKLGLSAGDTALVWASAEDNREAPLTGAAAPNLSRTPNYLMRIVERENSGETPDQGGADASQDISRESKSDESAKEQGKGGQQDSQGKPGVQGEQQSQQGGGGSDEGESVGQGAGKDQSAEKGQDAEETSGEEPKQPSEPSGDQAGHEPGNENHAGRPQETSFNSNGEEGAQPNGNANNDPAPIDGTDDGEAMRRILEHMRENGSGQGEGHEGSDSRTKEKHPANKTPDSGEQQPSSGNAADQESAVDEFERDDQEANNDTRDGASKRREDEDAAPGAGEENGAPREAGESNESAEVSGGQSSTGKEPTESRSGQPDVAESGEKEPSSTGTEGQNGADSRGTDTGKQADRHQEQPSETNSDDGQTDSKEADDPSPGGKSGGEKSGEQQDNDTTKSENQGDEDASRQSREGRSEQKSGRESGETAESGESSANHKEGKAGSSQQQEQQGERSESAVDPNAETEGLSSGPGDPTAGVRGGARPADPNDEVARHTHGQAADIDQEKANLEYADKATNMALDYLRDQHTQDDELLDKLGWNSEDVEEFLQRWGQMQRDSHQPGTRGRQAKRELEDVLNSMGLTPKSARVRQNSMPIDNTRPLSNDGRRSLPPPKYREKYRAFLRSTMREEATVESGLNEDP